MNNLELLKELGKRLPNFTKDELKILSKLFMTNFPHREEALEILKEKYPETHDLTQEAIRIAEREKAEKEAEKIKKWLKK